MIVAPVFVGDRTVFVAEGCSGITSLVTLVQTRVLMADFSDSVQCRHAVFFATVVPIALAANFLRVILAAVLAIEVDVEFATKGPLHDWAGVGAYLIGCVCLLAVGEMLRRSSVERRAEAAQS